MQATDEQVDRIISILLRYGVILAASVVFAGGAWYLSRFGGLMPDFHTFRSEPQELRSVAGVWGGFLKLQPRSVIQLGLLLLIATPIARVAFSVGAFAVQHDRLYLTLTLVVLCALLWSVSGIGYTPR